MPKKLIPLPIDPFIAEMISELEKNPCLVVQAEPGTGKTTRIPPALLKAAFRKEHQEILVLEPRRLAAKMASTRVADEYADHTGEEHERAPGGLIGYQFRFEKKASAKTRLMFLTEGMLMRRLIGDPTLRNVAAVVLDEFHERHLHGDLGLAYLRRLQKTSRPDLRLVVMSATLDAQGISKYLDDCRTLQVPGSKFPISIEYTTSSSTQRQSYLENLVRDAVVEALSRADADQFGHVLVFLPGMADIRRAEQALEGPARKMDFDVLPLHGELERKEQERAIAPSKKTKVILATNVAETSLTIPGVNTVVDAGLARVASYSSWSGLPSLRTKGISKASAIQRAGRSGRTGPGRCFRLYSKGDFEGKASYEVPEISRADLCQSVLELSSMGVTDPTTLEWFEAPPPNSLTSARDLARMLGAITEQGMLTPLGRELVELPVHPRLGKLILEGINRGVGREAIEMAAMLSESRGGTGGSEDLFKEFESFQPHEVARRLISQLTAKVKIPAGQKLSEGVIETQLKQALLSAYPDRVARKKEGAAKTEGSGSHVQLVISGGGSVTMEKSALIQFSEYFVIPALQEAQSQSQVRATLRVQSLFPIEPEWLFDLEPAGVLEVDEMLWDSERKRVLQVSKMTYGQLILDETRGIPTNFGKAAQLLGVQIIKFLRTNIPSQDALKGFRARLSLFKKHSDATDLPECPSLESPEFLAATVQLCEGLTAWSELPDEESLVSAIVNQWLNLMGHAGLADRLDRELPVHTVLAARGRKVKINYEETQPPWIESRIQDYFGMSDGPRILSGKLPLTLHLLAPNYRAVQVTSDLKGFWERNYAEVRRELGRRYPRHAWPEDPFKPYVEPPRPPKRH